MIDLTIDRLLLIEDDVGILDFRCIETGMLLWPHIRISILRMIMIDLLYPSVKDDSAKPVARAQMEMLIRSLFWNTLILPWKADRQTNVCIVSNSLTGQWVDGKLFDRVAGYFSSDFRNTLTLEDHFEWRWPFPRHDERVLFLTPHRVAHAVTGYMRMRPRHIDLARSLVDYVRERAMHHLGWAMSAERAHSLSFDLARKIASLPQQYRAYERMLARIRPKLLMIGAACFGGAYATMILAARSQNVPTAEYQHGAVAEGHDGYNLSPTLRASEDYKRTLPDYFLSYGSWWNSQITVPLQKVIIGNPHRDTQMSRLSIQSEEKTDVLILSDGLEFGMYLDLAKAIESLVASRSWRVVIRPHPQERSWVKGVYGSQIGAITIDQNPDLMMSLNRSRVIISELSTGLFEAIGLVEEIYLWDTRKSRFCYPTHPFTSFSSAEELSKLMTSSCGTVHIDPNSFWAPNWRENYLAFLARFGVEN
jgi:hypothetical protein